MRPVVPFDWRGNTAVTEEHSLSDASFPTLRRPQKKKPWQTRPGFSVFSRTLNVGAVREFAVLLLRRFRHIHAERHFALVADHTELGLFLAAIQ